MKVVVDTNVLASGIFWKGTPNQVMKCWSSDHAFDLVISHDILCEYRDVLERMSKKVKFIHVDKVIEMITIYGKLVNPNSLDSSACRDPDDVKFIEAALAGEANYIVSGDNDLLTLKAYAGISILKPAAFLKELQC